MARRGQPMDENTRKNLSDFARFSGVGLEFAVTVALCGVAGWWVDDRLGWSPVGLLVGLLTGASVGFLYLVRKIGPGGQ